MPAKMSPQFDLKVRRVIREMITSTPQWDEMSYRKLAEETGIPFTTLKDIETERFTCKASTLLALFDYLGLSLDELLRKL